jgi:hypothetical protein
MTPTGRDAAVVLERFVREHFATEVTASSGPGTSHFNLRTPWKEHIAGFSTEPLGQFVKANTGLEENELVQRRLKDDPGAWCISLFLKRELPPELERQLPDEYEGMLVFGAVIEPHEHEKGDGP